MITDHAGSLGAAPAWVQELDLTLPITAQYIVTGNVHDVHAEEQNAELVSTTDLIHKRLVANEYDLIYHFDSLQGIWLSHVAPGVVSDEFFPDSHLNRATVGALAKLADLMLQAAAHARLRVALIIESGSLVWRDQGNVEAGRLMLVSRRLAIQDVNRVPGGARAVPAGNTIVWIADAENDAPEWLRHSDSTRTLRIPLPSLSTRRVAAGILVDADAAIDVFAETTQGLTLRAMRSIAELSRDHHGGTDRIEEAVRSYLAGVADSPWQDPDLLSRIRAADEIIGRRVLGQPRAVTRSLDVLLRSALGLTGAHQSGSSARPQGILFFAGPTGVGKTELAKSLAEVLFGAEDAYIRFDMSEFSAEHSEARLIGAPPGYIGHREGGELTNAVREKPFAVLLFDEIEKAHPRILDKFLQILDDGRLTDGSGDTVYFGESVIIFTSNLGAGAALHETDAAAPAAQDVIADRILTSIQRHFTDELERPELLSRIGDSIIVFDSITPDVGVELVAKYIDAVAETIRVRIGARLELAESVRRSIRDYALTKLAFGGRGIGTAIETALVNPLARALAATGAGEIIRVTRAQQRDDGWELTVDAQAASTRYSDVPFQRAGASAV